MERHVYDRAWAATGTCCVSRGSFGSWCSVGSRGLELIGRRVGSPGSLRPLPLLRLIHRARTSAFRGRPSRGGGAVSLLSGRGLGRAGLGSPGTRGPACAALRCAAHQRVCGQRRLSARCAGAGERSCGSPRPFMHLGFGPPFGKLNIKAQEERGPASGYSREGRFLLPWKCRHWYAGLSSVFFQSASYW